MFDKLFSPIKIKDLELRNRVVMSAMGTHESAESEDGRMVTDKLIAYHVARAKGGCGLNTIEVCAVDKASSPHGFLSLAEDKYIEGMKKLNDAIHLAGGKTCIQLWQGGLAVASDQTCEILLPNDTPLAPNYVVKAISEERLLSVIDAFGQATRRAVEAGFDSIEFHCAHNYLPHSMLSGGLNHRTDAWGGSFENREKFPLACIRAIRQNMPEGMPLFMRIGCHDDMLEGGLTVEEVIAFCKDAKEAGVDVLNISRGNIMTAATIYEVAPVDIPHVFNVKDAARIRKETGMLTMPCGRINTAQLAEKILENDEADLIVMARSQLADAEFCNKANEGKLNAIKYCIGCDQGCYDYFCKALYDPSVAHITCMRNPALLEEESMKLHKTTKPQKVLIVGGGIAGIEAATDLVECGHTPIIYEASDHLGGQFEIAGVAPRKADFTIACQAAIENIKDLGVEIHLNTVVTPEVIKKVQPDAVIIAIGSSSIVPNIAGINEDYVIDSHALLAGQRVSGKKAVVIGGGLVGIESSEYLAQKGFEVTVVEMKEKVLTELGQLRQIGTQTSLAQEPIHIMTKTTCQSIANHQVTVTTDDKEVTLDADIVVVAVGSQKNDSQVLQEQCQAMNIKSYVVGDAKAPRLALDAIHEAYQAVLKINQ